MESKKIVIPIHCVGEEKQIEKARKLEQIFTALGHKVSLVNLDGSNEPLVIQAYIDQQKPELLVTIDCSGFDLKLLGDDLYYNSLCVPAMHFLTKNPKEFEEELAERMNFTMEFYVDNEADKVLIQEKYKRVPNVNCIPGFFENGIITNYVSSEEIIKQVNGFPKLFASLFINSVECKEKNSLLSNIQVLDDYLQQVNLSVNQEERKELLAFVDLAFSYIEMACFEEQVAFIGNELERII